MSTSPNIDINAKEPTQLCSVRRVICRRHPALSVGGTLSHKSEHRNFISGTYAPITLVYSQKIQSHYDLQLVNGSHFRNFP